MNQRQSSPVRRPALTYFGGKWRLAPWIISHFPPHEIYVEPFGGGGSVLLRKSPSRVEIYNDLNTELVDFFRVLRHPSQSSRLFRLLKRTPYARDELRAAYGLTDDPVERARRLAVRSFQAFHPRAIFGDPAPFDCRISHNEAMSWANYVRALPRIIDRLRNVIIENRPALSIIAAHDSPQSLIYVDPPYPLSTRTSAQKYPCEMSDSDHDSLLDALCSVKGRVVISGYDHPLYRDRLSGWVRAEHAARVSNSGSLRTEVLWCSP